MKPMHRWLMVILAGALALPLVQCSKKNAADEETATGEPDESFVLKDETEGFQLTWIDAKGEFRVVMKVEDVPMEGRDTVRVLDPDKAIGRWKDPGAKVHIADLRTKREDGSYIITTMTNRDFEQIAVKRRNARGLLTMDSASPSARPTGLPTAQQRAGGSEVTGDPNATEHPSVIIYGAEWCQPCHQAKAYLSRKGIHYIEKDVDNDRAASREMQGKLQRAGLGGGSIPVLDVRGKIMVGFNPQSVDEALGRAM